MLVQSHGPRAPALHFWSFWSIKVNMEKHSARTAPGALGIVHKASEIVQEWSMLLGGVDVEASRRRAFSGVEAHDDSLITLDILGMFDVLARVCLLHRESNGMLPLTLDPGQHRGSWHKT